MAALSHPHHPHARRGQHHRQHPTALPALQRRQGALGRSETVRQAIALFLASKEGSTNG